jgi:ABC-type dipeptide/oligopeptide/nickel transport system permease component
MPPAPSRSPRSAPAWAGPVHARAVLHLGGPSAAPATWARATTTRPKVTTLIGQRLEPTLSLALITITLAVLIAVPLGVMAAWRFGGWLDRG